MGNPEGNQIKYVLSLYSMFPSSFSGESGRAYSKRDLYERGHVAVCSHKQVSSPCSSSSTSSPPSRRSASPSSCSPPSFYLRLPSPLPARGTVSYMMDNLKRVDYVKLVLCVFDIVFLQIGHILPTRVKVMVKKMPLNKQ